MLAAKVDFPCGLHQHTTVFSWTTSTHLLLICEASDYILAIKAEIHKVTAVMRIHPIITDTNDKKEINVLLHKAIKTAYTA